MAEHPAALVVKVARAIAVAQCLPGSGDLGHVNCPEGGPCNWLTDPDERGALTGSGWGWGDEARAALDAVREFDAVDGPQTGQNDPGRADTPGSP